MADAGLDDDIEEVLVPTEEVIEVRRGKKVTAERRFMPGYVLVRMEMSDQGYHLVSSINRVTGFLGPQGRTVELPCWLQRLVGQSYSGGPHCRLSRQIQRIEINYTHAKC